jgi:hypothetical protein
MRSIIHSIHLDKEQYTSRRGSHQKGVFGLRYLISVCLARTSGLYYKRVTIIIDPPSVVKVMLQIVASLMIVIDDARLRLS